MAHPSSDLEGILVIDKPGLSHDSAAQTAGNPAPNLPTSHDIVQRVRRLTGQRRIGHTGTLDPMASGVLVLCLGRTTRLVEYYQGHAKRYRAEITLGTATDTYDAVGRVTAEAPVPPLTAAALEDALIRYQGDILQQPPVYSALKQGGEPLHRKARRGEAVTVETRPVTIHAMTLVDWDGRERLTVDVHCSAGTYVRSLANDLGKSLGTVGHLSALRRTAAGAFSLEQAHTLDEIAADVTAHLLPAGTGLTMPIVQLDEENKRKLSFGQKIVTDSQMRAHMVKTRPHVPGRAAQADIETGTLLAACDDAGDFLGVVTVLQTHADGRQIWKAQKWLAAA